MCSLSSSYFVVQDMPEVISTTRDNIKRAAPAAAQDGRIVVEAVNLFDPQPRYGDGHIYLLRHILRVSLFCLSLYLTTYGSI